MKQNQIELSFNDVVKALSFMNFDLIKLINGNYRAHHRLNAQRSMQSRSLGEILKRVAQWSEQNAIQATQPQVKHLANCLGYTFLTHDGGSYEVYQSSQRRGGSFISRDLNGVLAHLLRDTDPSPSPSPVAQAAVAPVAVDRRRVVYTEPAKPKQTWLVVNDIKGGVLTTIAKIWPEMGLMCEALPYSSMTKIWFTDHKGERRNVKVRASSVLLITKDPNSLVF